MTDSPMPLDFTDLEAFVRVPRVTAIAPGPDGRVVAAIAEPDQYGGELVSSLWELDPLGAGPAVRLTGSEQGESEPLFGRDGAVLFTSKRPGPTAHPGTGDGDSGDQAGLWRLPPRGEAAAVARTAGGLSLRAVADDGTALATTSVLTGASLADDAEQRTARRRAKRTDIWHTGLPVRRWDRELDQTEPRLVLVAPDGTLTDLCAGVDPAPDPTINLLDATADLSRDGATVVSTWTERVRGGQTRTSIVAIDTATGRRTVLLAGGVAGDDCSYQSPRLSPAATAVAVIRVSTSTPTDTSYPTVEIHPLGPGADPVRVELGDLTVADVVWIDDDTLAVAGDLHSSGAVCTVDAATGRVTTLADDGVYSGLRAGPDGALYALRADLTTPPRPVRLADGEVRVLRAPGEITELPGTLTRLRTSIDGTSVSAWLCLPHAASATEPAPVMLWIHGGPHASYNSWSWRWSPWTAVARGYAVLLPDPAMSTGYGPAGLNRGWPRRPDVVYAEVSAVLDDALTRDDLDATRTALLGASFGGFMVNWIAGHTDRFAAIVSHAGLWALDQQHRISDIAAWKMREHGHEDGSPAQADWYRRSSPHHHAHRISTPMLITHGDRDFRVPIGEALRQWWDLVSGWAGEPDTMPHRFLQLTSENHWVLTPSNWVVWQRAMWAFCDQHVLGTIPLHELNDRT